jgi:hypothetical protein
MAYMENEITSSCYAQVERHITTLKRLRNKLEERAEVKSRQDEFRDWKRTFAAKKEAILSGQIVPREVAKTFIGATVHSRSVSPNSRQALGASVVLESLNKLSDLESRIMGNYK